MVRMSDAGIAQKRDMYAKQHRSNQTMRSFVKVGASMASVAALAWCVYWVLHADPAEEAQAVIPGNVSNLIDLESRVAALESKSKGPSFGSKSWFKALGIDIIMSQSVTVLEYLVRLGYHVTESIFYEPTLLWYINQRSRVGTIAQEPNEHGVLEYTLIQGQLVGDFEYSAQALDDAEFKSRFDYEYTRNRAITAFKMLVEEFERLVAFMYYKAEQTERSSMLYAELPDRARYIYNSVNTLSGSLEQALRIYDAEFGFSDTHHSKHVFMQLFQDFFNDFKQVVLSFVRIESDQR
jgi:hypothetical protein